MELKASIAVFASFVDLALADLNLIPLLTGSPTVVVPRHADVQPCARRCELAENLPPPVSSPSNVFMEAFRCFYCERGRIVWSCFFPHHITLARLPPSQCRHSFLSTTRT
jgi:hypothetical protein